MSAELLNTALKIAAAAAGLVSAYLWIRSTKARVEYTGGAAVTWTFADGFTMDVAKTAMEQSRWNSRAAIAAAVGAVLVATSLTIEMLWL